MAQESPNHQRSQSDGPTRRKFLAAGVGLGAATFLGGWPALGEPMQALPAPGQPDGEFLGLVPFLKRKGQSFGEVTGRGLEGRRYLDLASLSDKTLITASDRFFLRTRSPESLPSVEEWKVRVRLYDDGPSFLGLDWLRERQRDLGVHLIEGTSNQKSNGFGAISVARWSGVPVTDLLEGFELDPYPYGLLISGFDRHPQPAPGERAGASWIFSFDQLEQTGAFLATGMNGRPLTADQGAPVRLVVPGWFGCCCIKWVQDIVAVDADIPVTPQMRDYARPLLVEGRPRFARLYPPAEIGLSAVAARVERWRVGGEIVVRIVGVVWGGAQPLDDLRIRVISETSRGSTSMVAEPITDYHAPANTHDWALWSHTVKLEKAGRYSVNCLLPDGSVTAKRLTRGKFARRFFIAAS